jgi:serine/threonine protein kinase
MSGTTNRFLARGTSGCILYPALPCDPTHDNTDKTKVTKLFSETYERNKEFKNNMIANNIHNFTLRALEKCTISRNEVDTKTLKKCGNRREIMPAIIYTAGSIDLNEACKTIPFTKLLKDLQPVFSGLRNLHDKGWVHGDVKPGNIVYTQDRSRLALIDFGSAFDFNTLAQLDLTAGRGWETYTYIRSEYVFFPPDMPAFAQHIENNVSTRRETYDINQNYTQLLSFIQKRMEYIMHDERDVIHVFIDACTSFMQLQPLQYVITVNKIDVYMLGVTMLNMIVNAIMFHQYDMVDDPNKLIELVLHMIHPDQSKRLDIHDAYKIYESIIGKPTTPTFNNQDYVIAIVCPKSPMTLLTRTLALLDEHNIDPSRIHLYVSNEYDLNAYKDAISSAKAKAFAELSIGSRKRIAKRFAIGMPIVLMDGDVVRVDVPNLHQYIIDTFRKENPRQYKIMGWK